MNMPETKGCQKILALLLCMVMPFFSKAQSVSNGNILVFSKTEGGYRHASIEAGKRMFLKLGEEKNYVVDTTEDATAFTSGNLHRYHAIVFLSTRGNVLDSAQQAAFQSYIRSGGGFTGIHAATTTEYEWPWYNQLVGAYFNGHPEPQRALYRVLDHDFPAMKNLPDTFRVMDEVYDFRAIKDSLRFLISVDEQSYSGGKTGAFHPISWYHEFEGGRSFYTALGHFDEAYTDPMFINMVWKGLRWTMKRF